MILHCPKCKALIENGLKEAARALDAEQQTALWKSEAEVLRTQLMTTADELQQAREEAKGLYILRDIHTYRGDGIEETMTWACSECIEKDKRIKDIEFQLAASRLECDAYKGIFEWTMESWKWSMTATPEQIAEWKRRIMKVLESPAPPEGKE